MEPGPEETRRFACGDADHWNEIIGPVYDAPGLRHTFGITEPQLNEMIKSNAVVSLATFDGMVGFPANCFGADGKPLPRLAEVIGCLLTHEFADPWSIAMWLNDRPEVWGGASALELIQTGWADEVILQAGEAGRSAPPDRARRDGLIRIAAPILDKVIELVSDYPVTIHRSTLFVSLDTDVPYAVFAVTIDRPLNGLRAGRFSLEGNLADIALQAAESIRRSL